MGIHLELVDFDQLFHERSGPHPKIINDFSDATEKDKDAINKLIYSKYLPTDLLTNTPICGCGETTGAFNLHIACPKCGTTVEYPSDQNLEPLVWMRKPEGINALLHPDIYGMLCDRFKIGGFDLIRYLADVTYKSDSRIPPIVEYLQSCNIKRGYNFFVEHFDHILSILFNTKPFYKKDVIDPLYLLVQQDRHKVFPNYLPLPNRSLLIVENTNMGIFIDSIITDAVDAIQTIVSIDNPMNNYSVREKENRVIKSIVQLDLFYRKYKQNNLAGKEGVFRKQVYGSRAHWSGRAVVSSITDAHDLDEVQLPWSLGVGLFRTHLQSKLLMKRGMSYTESASFLNDFTQRYHPLLDELFQELINESPWRTILSERHGIPCLFQRNPSLERASAQAMLITKVKTDLTDVTIGMSILSVKGLNADFDGDQLNLTLFLDNETAKAMQNLAPHKSAFSLKESRDVAKNISMSMPAVSMIANWYHTEEEPDPVKLQRMMALPDA